MNEKKQTPFGHLQVLKNSLELLFLSLIRKQEIISKSSFDVSVNVNTNSLVDNIKSMLNSKIDLAENINLERLSFELGFSKSYLKSSFKKATGFSVMQYFIKLKMDKAKKLLSQRKYSVTEIADILGYASIHYFSRQFKISTGMSPSEYVNSIKADNLL